MIRKVDLEIRNVKYSTMVGEWPSSITMTVKRDGMIFYQKYFADKRARGLVFDDKEIADSKMKEGE